jgi:NADH:ubiquinone oxidoreductase subunit 5 (subunit L)/multisubunit Na+/H+ antiporter MnhA subunit
MSQQYKENYYNQKFHYFDYLSAYLEQNLESSKKSNQAILNILIILFFLVFFKIIIFICNKYKTKNEDKIKKIIMFITLINFCLIFICWILSLVIVTKVNKLRKDDDDIGITNPIKKGIVKVILILTADLIIGLIQLCLPILKFCDETNNSSNYNRTTKITYNNTNSNNYQTNIVRQLELIE